MDDKRIMVMVLINIKLYQSVVVGTRLNQVGTHFNIGNTKNKNKQIANQ